MIDLKIPLKWSKCLVSFHTTNHTNFKTDLDLIFTQAVEYNKDQVLNTIFFHKN